VAETKVVGGRAPELHVEVDPRSPGRYGCRLTRVVEALRNSNVIVPAGMIQENYHLYLTTVTGLFRDRQSVEDTVVDVVKGTPVLVKNLAQVKVGERPAYDIVTADGRRAVLVNVLSSRAGTPSPSPTRQRRDRRHPEDPARRREAGVFYDESILVRASIRGVWRASSSAWAGGADPGPVPAQLAQHPGGGAGDPGGHADGGGVHAPGAHELQPHDPGRAGRLDRAWSSTTHRRWWRTSSSPLEGRAAARGGAGGHPELTPALIGSTLTPMVVFVPLVFLGGITAVFFRALALTLVTALLASLLLALMFTPVLAGGPLRPTPGCTRRGPPWAG
jgi:multidrug efflux pump subunit AcrB